MISIIVTTRNDNYDGCGLHRNQVFVRVLLALAKRHRLDAELIIVEWRPPSDRPGLAEAIRWPRDKTIPVRLIQVPEEIHRTIEHSDVIPFFQMQAKNVGIRRAKGDWVLCTNADLLYSDEMIAYLSTGGFGRHCYYRAARHDLELRRMPGRRSVDQWLAYCEKNVYLVNDRRKKGSPFTRACGDFVLMHRDEWFRLKAYPEVGRWSIFVDGLLLHAAWATGLTEVRLPHPIYHLFHGKAWNVTEELGTTYPSLDYKEEYRPWCKAMLESRRCITPNDPNWGYAEVEFDEIVI